MPQSSRSTSTGSSAGSSSSAGGAENPPAVSPLHTGQGDVTIADGVVQKLAGLAARQVAGVHDLGGGTARALGALAQRIPGATQSAGQGVSVEVGERQAAVDLDVVTEYGAPITDVARAVRRNVISTIEGMTGLQVTEVNIAVHDIHLPDDDSDGSQGTSRVR